VAGWARSSSGGELSRGRRTLTLTVHNGGLQRSDQNKGKIESSFSDLSLFYFYYISCQMPQISAITQDIRGVSAVVPVPTRTTSNTAEIQGLASGARRSRGIAADTVASALP
jgi:hypothetical protein